MRLLQVKGVHLRLFSLLQSRLSVIFILAAFAPLWVTTRMISVMQTIRNPVLMNGTDIFLGSATVPIKLFPWYYDVNARAAFLAKNDPLGEWNAGDYTKAVYEHIPPWEPGIAIPLRLCRKLLNTPVSLMTLISCQVGLDFLVLVILGAVCFEVGGFVGSVLAVVTYAGWTEVAGAAALPFYYYWPVPFSMVLIGMLILLQSRIGVKTWPLIALMIGFNVGLWCWFRGTAVSFLVGVPILLLFCLPSRRRSLYAAILAMVAMSLVLLPSAIHNWPRSHSILPRGQIWHDMVIGIGTRPNPYGIVHLDGYAATLILSKYGIAFREAGYEEALRKEYLAILYKDPALIIRNFFLNLFYGLRGGNFVPDLLQWHKSFWLAGLIGLTILIYKRDQRWRWLGAGFMVWLVQCATLALVKLPDNSYLWETLGVSVLCGAAGAGVIFEEIFRFGMRRVEHAGIE